MIDSPRKGSLLVIFLTVFIDLLGFGMVLPLLPIYGKQFALEYDWSDKTVGLVAALLMSSFSAMQFIFSPLWGRLSDRVGRRPVLMVGLLGSTLFYGLFGWATAMQSLVLLFVARIGAGIAGATIATAQAYIADTTTVEKRSKGMALIGAAFGLGFTFGPLLGAAAWVSSSNQVDISPWPGYLASILSAVALVLAIWLLPESLSASSQSAAKHNLGWAAWRDAFSTPSVGALLIVSFISVVAFGGFESTLSLLLKNEPKAGGFGFQTRSVLYMFAFIGVVLSVVQGGFVRRMSGRISEVKMASFGGVLTIVGFLLLIVTTYNHNLPLLFVAAAIEVSGFACMTPSLQGLISRRSDPLKQGGILGVSQSVSALARIAGPLVSMPLFAWNTTWPYWLSAGLTGIALLLLASAARGGRDYAVPT